MIQITEDEARRDIEKGRRASAELELTREAFAILRAETLEAIVFIHASEVALRERLIVTVQTLDHVKEALEKMVTEGESSQNLLNRLATSRAN